MVMRSRDSHLHSKKPFVLVCSDKPQSYRAGVCTVENLHSKITLKITQAIYLVNALSHCDHTVMTDMSVMPDMNMNEAKAC